MTAIYENFAERQRQVIQTTFGYMAISGRSCSELSRPLLTLPKWILVNITYDSPPLEAMQLITIQYSNILLSGGDEHAVRRIGPITATISPRY